MFPLAQINAATPSTAAPITLMPCATKLLAEPVLDAAAELALPLADDLALEAEAPAPEAAEEAPADLELAAELAEAASEDVTDPTLEVTPEAILEAVPVLLAAAVEGQPADVGRLFEPQMARAYWRDSA